MIKTIPLDQTLPGMVLGEKVMSGSNMLLPLGTVINISHINSLRRCGVSAIVVLAPSELTVVEINEQREALRGRVERLFRRAGSNATMQSLQRAVLEYQLEKLN
ncbi:MAG: hypothetical protein Q7J20_05060 [Candidatus Nitrotoga sp.]|jgi:hypothetical protein|nr:hypothetical protein [Candidatus Nitrotoga sp.]MDO9447257.1 hypothetical protein [Candidatus Nitrotoga sp.]MDP1637495.1 hypothetical protein [Candidatus Nitrotoga sp.]MDP3497475.1 hypothetical protein [Candidatus Nitrotoga sp.]RFC40362.1 MAG: hypothetical protein DID89_2727547017 [Candidatus Nitrotoga sp. CP45]